MASKIDKSLVEKHLQCPVCQGILDDARMLQCGHSYCKTCIGAVIDSKQRRGGGLPQQIACPSCRQKVSIQGGSSSGLKRNWIVNNILQALAESERQEKEAPEVITCEVHPGTEEDYYCETCNIVVCSNCAISDHIHFDRGTRPEKIEKETIDIIIERIEGLLKKADVWSAQHVAYEDDIADIKKVGSQAIDLVERDFLQEYDARLEQLNQSRERLLGHVTKSRKFFCDRMDELLQTERVYTASVKQCSILAKCKMDSGKGKDVVRFYKDWSEVLEEIMLHDVPDIAGAESDMKMIRALYFEKSPIPSDSLYIEVGFIGHHLKLDDLQRSTEDEHVMIDGGHGGGLDQAPRARFTYKCKSEN